MGYSDIVIREAATKLELPSSVAPSSYFPFREVRAREHSFYLLVSESNASSSSSPMGVRRRIGAALLMDIHQRR